MVRSAVFAGSVWFSGQWYRPQFLLAGCGSLRNGTVRRFFFWQCISLGNGAFRRFCCFSVVLCASIWQVLLPVPGESSNNFERHKHLVYPVCSRTYLIVSFYTIYLRRVSTLNYHVREIIHTLVSPIIRARIVDKQTHSLYVETL